MPPLDHSTTIYPEDLKDLLKKRPDLFLTKDPTTSTFAGLLLIHGTWTTRNLSRYDGDFLRKLSTSLFLPYRVNVFFGSILIDESPELIESWLGDKSPLHIPPGDLPAFAMLMQESGSEPYLKYLPVELFRRPLSTTEFSAKVLAIARIYRNETFENYLHCPIRHELAADAVRIFVAGDRSSVGKSSTCLGILGTLIHQHGYKAEQLAYIKPATQSESTQLIELYCQKMNIECMPIGPIVYYRGFTRAFLEGSTDSTESLLLQAQRAVDRICVGKKVVLIDGVGFPAVGSICGTDNASIARICGYRISEKQRKPCGVILVGGSGVGAAVDAFNLNATYFESAEIPVLGAIFNKLDLEGFYSLENCKTQVTSYFSLYQPNRKAFGFMPKYNGFTKVSRLDRIEEYFDLFAASVDVKEILLRNIAVKETEHNNAVSVPLRPTKRLRTQSAATVQPTSRHEIEQAAINAGAAPSA